MELIPRTRRALGGPVAANTTLTDDEVKALIADAVAEVVFYTGGVFGHQLLVTNRDGTYNAPDEWAIDPALDEAETTVIVAQAALSYFFHEFRDLKVQEEIANEGASWSYSLSANLVLEQMKMLREARDKALDNISALIPVVWVNLLEARDAATAAAIEPYAVGAGGQQLAP